MGDAGSPYALFQRAIKARNLVSAQSAAYSLPHLSLADATALVVLAAEIDPHGFFPPAAIRWTVRFLTENPGVTLEEAQLVVAALGSLRAENLRAGLLTLLAVSHSRGLNDVEATLRKALAPG